MQLILVKFGEDNIAVIDIPHDSDGDFLAQMVQVEFSIPADEQQLEHEGNPIENYSLAAMGIVDGSTITVKRVKRNRVSIYDIPSDIKPEQLIALTQSDPNLMKQFMSMDPKYGEVLATGDVGKVRTFLMKREMDRHKTVYTEKQDEIALAADPTNTELLQRVDERNRLKEVQNNYLAAQENLPEAFGSVLMLYVDIQVNGHHVKAFVDSGAQSTIMSIACAERCGITRLIDTRFAGMAKGVGTAKIVGRVHIAQMKFGNSVFPISITVLENDDVDFLFGLDTLRRYRCCIDLDKNVLRIEWLVEGAKVTEEVGFLPENELPARARGHLVGDAMDTEDGGDGFQKVSGEGSSGDKGADKA